ncbi:MAG: N-acetylmuramoyl-L-alanine amidase [Acidobacteriia bacterium]|nr:N-acetylmuramoyl-L-alanine amidase [Terriglobia bacterium]
MSLDKCERLYRFRNPARIERQADSIGDPIARLKYLRQATAAAEPVRRRWGPFGSFCMVAILLSMRSDAQFRHPSNVRQTDRPLAAESLRVAPQEIPNVWRIAETKDFEVYSNGLRVEDELAVANEPRLYRLLSVGAGRNDGRLTDDKGRSSVLLRSQPAGIVFHTTESDQAPFEAAEQHNLQRIGRETLLYVRSKRAYHFVIDRFGRVHRIVVESDAANHAGNSVWADSRWLYLELNQSFLGVSFEASMQTDQPPINEAQTHAARVLTEMLRCKYHIAAENCVTHAQVSVNPDNMRIGWHCDWGKGFPFAEIGLPENYELPVPSLYLLGFESDPAYIHATGPGLWKGLAVAEERLREAAGARRMGVAAYRTLLQKRYRDEIAALKDKSVDEENRQ